MPENNQWYFCAIFICFLALNCQPDQNQKRDDLQNNAHNSGLTTRTENCFSGQTDSLLWGAWDWQYSLDPNLPNYVKPPDVGYTFRLQFTEDCQLNIYRKSLIDFAFVLDSTYHYSISNTKFDTLKIEKPYEFQNASLFYPLEYRWYLVGFYGSDTLQLQGFYEDTRKRGPFYDYFVKVE